MSTIRWQGWLGKNFHFPSPVTIYDNVHHGGNSLHRTRSSCVIRQVFTAVDVACLLALALFLCPESIQNNLLSPRALARLAFLEYLIVGWLCTQAQGSQHQHHHQNVDDGVGVFARTHNFERVNDVKVRRFVVQF